MLKAQMSGKNSNSDIIVLESDSPLDFPGAYL